MACFNYRRGTPLALHADPRKVKTLPAVKPTIKVIKPRKPVKPTLTRANRPGGARRGGRLF